MITVQTRNVASNKTYVFTYFHRTITHLKLNISKKPFYCRKTILELFTKLLMLKYIHVI